MRSAILLAAAAIASLGAACHSADVDAAAAPSGSSMIQSPVLVELFTSQGCSSCPPADRLLPQLRTALDGVTVLPLAYHVDYWNDLGWRDPFSSAEWTARQLRYARLVSDGEIYTPQLVIQGAAHVVGSNRSDAEEAIRAAATRAPEGRLRAWATGRDQIEIEAELLATSSLSRADAWVAMTESGLSTRVARGENHGRALPNEHVVRRLEHAFSIEKGNAHRSTLSLAPARDWNRDRLAVIVFLQDPKSLRILAATVANGG